MVPFEVSANYLYYFVWKTWRKWYGTWKIMNRFIHISSRSRIQCTRFTLFSYPLFSLSLFFSLSPFPFTMPQKDNFKIKSNSWCDIRKIYVLMCSLKVIFHRNIYFKTSPFYIWIRINSILEFENWKTEKFFCLEFCGNGELKGL